MIRVCDEWFVLSNPLVTQMREEVLRRSFGLKLGLSSQEVGGDFGGRFLSLNGCYDILFTDDERSDLPFEYFLEDWSAFIDSYNSQSGERDALKRTDAMTLNVALQFLKAMQ